MTSGDYSNIIFYKLQCKTSLSQELFIGYTMDFSKTEESHKTLWESSTSQVYQEIRKTGGWENWRMEMLGVRDCASELEAKHLEKEYALSLGGEILSAMSEFYCAICDYHCSSKFLWRQHSSTKKHLRNVNKNKEVAEVDGEKRMPTCFSCEICGNVYKQRSGLWRHRKRCQGKQDVPLDINQLMHDMLANDAKMREEMMLQMKQQNKIIQEMIPKMGNNNNNKFSINVFLNEQCRDAINMSDFIKSLQIQIGDLLYSKDNGLIQGVSSILLKGLRELDTYKRPIHCTDVKRETLYIKNNNEWDRNNCKDTLKTAITDVASRQRKLITAWESANPGWQDTSGGKEEYIKLVKTVMDDMNEDKIIRNIAKGTVIEKM